MASTLASEDYVKSHARQCPHCNAPIEKNDGCNKVTLGLYCNEIEIILYLSDHVLAMRHKLLLAVRQEAGQGEPLLPL